jgi:hypothetical protein
MEFENVVAENLRPRNLDPSFTFIVGPGLSSLPTVMAVSTGVTE